MLIPEYRQLANLNKLANNPRTIKDKSFKTLCDSLRANPDYFEARPLILSDRTGELVIIAGNQRYEAAKAIGLDSVPTILLPELTEQREREIVIRDNVSLGTFDWDAIANEWDENELKDWGVDLPIWDAVEETETENDNYSRKIEPPIYDPVTDRPPPIADLTKVDKTNQLLADIEQAKDISDEVRQFLIDAAQRHRAFNYQKIADYYSHAPAHLQRLFEDSALVVIDFNQAIEKGFVTMSKALTDGFIGDYPDEDAD